VRRRLWKNVEGVRQQYQYTKHTVQTDIVLLLPKFFPVPAGSPNDKTKIKILIVFYYFFVIFFEG